LHVQVAKTSQWFTIKDSTGLEFAKINDKTTGMNEHVASDW